MLIAFCTNFVAFRLSYSGHRSRLALRIATREARVTKVSTIGQTPTFLSTSMHLVVTWALLNRRVPVLN